MTRRRALLDRVRRVLSDPGSLCCLTPGPDRLILGPEVRCQRKTKNQDCHMDLAEIEFIDFGAHIPRPTPRWILNNGPQNR